MSNRIGQILNGPKNFLLARGGVAALEGPLVIGIGQRRGRMGRLSIVLTSMVAAALVVAISPLIVVAAPQSIPAQRTTDIPRFEVASVKPSRPVAGQGVFFGMVSDPSRFRGSFVTLADLVGKAYDVDVSRISGGDSWISKERYDVVATLPKNASQGQIPILLQTLLAERFGLTVRRDTKMSQVYALVPTKSGPKLKRSEAATSPPPTGPPATFSAPGIVSSNGGGLRLCCGRAQLTGISMARLADLLSSQTDRPVQDYTGIQGLFDVSLEWNPDDTRPQPDGVPPPTGPSIYSAIQEQLGLRLEPRTGLSDYLFIVHAARPTEN